MQELIHDGGLIAHIKKVQSSKLKVQGKTKRDKGKIMKKTFQIAVIAGDGTGPEVVAEGLKVLKAVAQKGEGSFNFIPFDLGGERYLRTGDILPETELNELKKMDAIYLGAIGHPEVKPGILEKGLLLRLRFDLDQYINLDRLSFIPGGNAFKK